MCTIPLASSLRVIDSDPPPGGRRSSRRPAVDPTSSMALPEPQIHQQPGLIDRRHEREIATHHGVGELTVQA